MIPQGYIHMYVCTYFEKLGLNLFLSQWTFSLETSSNRKPKSCWVMISWWNLVGFCMSNCCNYWALTSKSERAWVRDICCEKKSVIKGFPEGVRAQKFRHCWEGLTAELSGCGASACLVPPWFYRCSVVGLSSMRRVTHWDNNSNFV